MWSSSYEQEFAGLSGQRVWEVWSDVDRWSSWQGDVEYARIDGAFTEGATIAFKPKGGPRVRVELTDVQAPARYVDVTHFPLARMIDEHELVETAEGVQIRNTVTMAGPLAFLWRKLVGEAVAKSLPDQTARLVERGREAT
jgi:hypothetical protein